MIIGPKVGIYKVHTRHTRYGLNYGSYTLVAKNCDAAVARARKEFAKGEKVEWVEILATTLE